MTRPQIIVNGGSPGAKAAVNGSSTVTFTLDSTIGVRSVQWTVLSTDETASVGDYPLTPSGSLGQTATTTALGPGTAFIVRVIVNNGLVRGVSDPMGTTSTVKVYVPTAEGLEVGAAGETLESDPVYGSTGIINAAVRAVSTAISAVMGVPIKTALLVSTTNLTLNGAATIDSFAVATGDIILAVGQSAPEENGLYAANTAGDWARSEDFDSIEEIRGAIIAIIQGTVGSGRIYQNTNSGSIVVGTTALTFAQLSNRADKTKLDGSTSAATSNRLVQWDGAANLNANAFYGSGIVSTTGLLRGAYLANFIGMRNVTDTGDVVLLSGKSVNGVTLGSDDCEVVELRAQNTGLVGYYAGGFGTYATFSYDSGTAVSTFETFTTMKLTAQGGAGTVRVVSDNIELQDGGGGAQLALSDGAGFFGATDYGGGSNVIHINVASIIPTSNPAVGFIIYVDPGTGSLMARGSAGTITPLAVA